MSANARMTLGAALGTITTAANTLSSTFDAANKGIGMLNTLVSDAAENQKLRSKANRERFVTQLIEDSAMEDTLRARKIDDFCEDADNKRHFEERYAVYESLLRSNKD